MNTLAGHEDFVSTLVKMNDDLIVSGSQDKTIKVWQLSTASCLKTLIEHQSPVFTLIKISNEKSNPTAASNELKSFYFQAQIKRLEAELKREPFVFEVSDNEQLQDFIKNENALYLTNKKQLESKIMILKEQIKQKENELKELRIVGYKNPEEFLSNLSK